MVPQRMVEFFGEPSVLATIGSIALLILGEMIRRLFTPGDHVLWGKLHGFTFVVSSGAAADAQTVQLHTGTMIVQNFGRAPAEEVEVHLGYKPGHFQLWPTFNYATQVTPEGHFIVSIPSLGRNEWVTIEMVQFGGQLPDVLRVRSKHQEARQRMLRPFVLWPVWARYGTFSLTLVGLFSILFAALYVAFR